MKTFDVWYPNLEQNLNKITDSKEEEKPELNKSKGITNEILEEILELSRTNQKILRNPELLLPRDYLEYVLSDNSSASEKQLMNLEKQRHMSMEAENRIMFIREMFEKYKEMSKPVDEELYTEFRHLMNLVQQQSMISRENYERIVRRRK